MSGTAPPSARRASVKGRMSKQQQNRRCVCPRAPLGENRRALFSEPRSGAIRGTIGRRRRWKDTKSASPTVALGFRAYRHVSHTAPLANGVSTDASRLVSARSSRSREKTPHRNRIVVTTHPPARPPPSSPPADPTLSLSLSLLPLSLAQGRRARAPDAGAPRPDDARAVPGVRRPGGWQRRRSRLIRRARRGGAVRRDEETSRPGPGLGVRVGGARRARRGGGRRRPGRRYVPRRCARRSRHGR